MAAIKHDSKEVAVLLSKKADTTTTTMTESPLKLVEQTVNAASMRQRIGSTLSPGMHFRAPSKAACDNSDGGLDRKRLVGKTPSSLQQLQQQTETETSYFKETKSSNKVLLNNSSTITNGNNSTPTTTGTGTTSANGVGGGDDSQHSSTSEYGSMADTHSTISDSRLSSPLLARSGEWQHQRNKKEQSMLHHHHEKSPSWPEMYYHQAASSSTPPSSAVITPPPYRTQSCWNGVAQGTPASSSPTESGIGVDNGSPIIDRTLETIKGNFTSTMIVDRYDGVASMLAYCGGGDSMDSENTDGGDTSTLRRCSAQSMREICPKLLKKLQQQPQQQQQMQQYARTSMRDKGQQQQRRYYSPRRDNLVARPSLGGGGSLASNDDESGRILRSSSLMHSKSPSQISSSAGSNDSSNQGVASSSTPKTMRRESDYVVDNNNSNNRSFISMHESMTSKYGSGKSEHAAMVRRSASSENVVAQVTNGGAAPNLLNDRLSYYHSTNLVPSTDYDHQRKSAINSYGQIRHIDDDENDDYGQLSNVGKLDNTKTARVVRYQQRHQNNKTTTPAQSSIRRKFQQQVVADVSPARSLPDLSAKEPFRDDDFEDDVGDEHSPSSYTIAQWPPARQKQQIEDDSLAYATSQRLMSFSSSFTTSPLYAVPHKLNNNHEQQQQFLMTKASPPPPPPLPRKPPPAPRSPPSSTKSSAVKETNDDRQIEHCRRSSDGGPAVSNEPCTVAEQTGGNSVAMISRKLFADQIRVNSLSGTNFTTADSGVGQQKSIVANNKIFQCQPTTTTNQVQTNFPTTGVNVNRRVVQVHPMCMNAASIGDQREETHHQSQMSSASSTSSSSGQFSPPNNPLSHSPPMQNSDPKLSVNKPRPPVPKKPAKLTTSTTMTMATQKFNQVPMRPPKPYSNSNLNLNGENGIGNGDDGHFLNFGQKENGSSLSATNGTSPFKQRKHLEEEEKCRELFNYVAQKSNDTSLKQILAPNQRCSVDYLEECFANARISTIFGDNGYDDGSAEISKQSFYSVNINGQNGSGRQPSRTLSTDSVDLEKEKIDLIARMSRKLKVLKEEQRAVEEEIRCNNELGASLFSMIDDSMALPKPTKDRFRQFNVDTENITQLLLKLSCQLARMDNELNRLPQGQFNEKAAKEKQQQLADRRQRLMSQLRDAKDLREDLDRRGEQMMAVLRSILSQEQVADYQYFIQMKYKLLLDGREIDDKIKLGEDQKRALEQSLSKA